MTPRRRRGGGEQQLNEAAQLTNELIAAGYSRKQVADILGRNSSIVSRFFTRGRGTGGAYVEALRNVTRRVREGGPADVEELQGIAAAYVTRRTTKEGKKARVRTKDVTETPGHSSMARAAKQHIKSGASRLRPVIAKTAAVDGKVAFTVRAKKEAFIHPAGARVDSPGVRRNVVQRDKDNTEERSYGQSPGAGQGPGGFDAVEWQGKVDAAGGDVAAAVQGWMVQTGRLRPGAEITHLEVRGWKPPPEEPRGGRRR
ncbi:hypothetical protein [Streptantibioticus ferralitis]|uniref:Helix-turn-helix domain containing protein n=1 Tax=Streptantibioticus ferralitis TaxID=236510 RepID=A0ABT5ZCZ5_9ACTN|nr:hypothetical protein [Streptantibioticus ferralitis]MDF2260910.1 hypothetical protein [Streptantibioticus ferralitis]